jgi:hypothetical protein
MHPYKNQPGEEKTHKFRLVHVRGHLLSRFTKESESADADAETDLFFCFVYRAQFLRLELFGRMG